MQPDVSGNLTPLQNPSGQPPAAEAAVPEAGGAPPASTPPPPAEGGAEHPTTAAQQESHADPSVAAREQAGGELRSSPLSPPPVAGEGGEEEEDEEEGDFEMPPLPRTACGWRFGDIGAIVVHVNDYADVKQALGEACFHTRAMGKRAGVLGWINKNAGAWKADPASGMMAIGITPIGAAALQGLEGYPIPEGVSQVRDKFEWHPCLRRPESDLLRLRTDLPEPPGLVSPFAKRNVENPRFTFTDMFAGIGGFRLGLEEVGGACVHTIEQDVFARRIYADNFGELPEGRDITQVAGGVVPKGHTMLTGGFPCGPFTTASRKERLGLEDPRGLLFLQLSRLLRDSQPETFLLENVPGVQKEAGLIKSELADAGYDVSFFGMDASCVVAQNRLRTFFIGFRNDIASKVLPEGGYRPPPLPAFNLTYGDIVDTRVSAMLREKLDSEGRGGELPPIDADLLKRYIIGPSAMKRLEGSPTSLIRCRRRHASLDEPIGTLMSSYKSSPDAYSMIADGCRFFTELECGRAQGFPDSFLRDSKRVYHQMGNAVPAPLMAIIGHHIASHLDGEEPSYLPGWAAAARLSLQAVNDPEAVGARPVSLPTGDSMTLRDLSRL